MLLQYLIPRVFVWSSHGCHKEFQFRLPLKKQKRNSQFFNRILKKNLQILKAVELQMYNFHFKTCHQAGIFFQTKMKFIQDCW